MGKRPDSCQGLTELALKFYGTCSTLLRHPLSLIPPHHAPAVGCTQVSYFVNDADVVFRARSVGAWGGDSSVGAPKLTLHRHCLTHLRGPLSTQETPTSMLPSSLLILSLTVTLVAAGPCDIYASGNTPCVAAHSTTRALFNAYSGPLYRIKRASDNATSTVSPLSAGGVANASAQDSFCASTTCAITTIFDQSGRGNHLTGAPPGSADPSGPDKLAPARGAPVLLNGKKAYGVFIAPGTGYRNDATNGIAKVGSALFPLMRRY